MLAGGHMLEEVARGRFRLHDLLRLYATELSATEESSDGRAEAVKRLLGWYFDTSNAAGTVIAPPDHPAFLLPPLSTQDFTSHDEAFTWCRTESANLLAAARLAEEQHSPTAWQIPVALWNYFIVSSALDEWTRTYRVAERTAARDGNQAARAWAVHGQALSAFRGQRFADALELFDRALAIRREIGDSAGAAWSLTGLGMAYGGLRQFDLAVDRFGEALRGHAEVGSWFGEGGHAVVPERHPAFRRPVRGVAGVGAHGVRADRLARRRARQGDGARQHRLGPGEAGSAGRVA